MWYNRTLTVLEQSKTRRFRASEIVTLIFEVFFQRPKLRGNKDKGFFDKINHVLVCLVAAAIRHSLKEIRAGNREETVEFKYETGASE